MDPRWLVAAFMLSLLAVPAQAACPHAPRDCGLDLETSVSFATGVVDGVRFEAIVYEATLVDENATDAMMASRDPLVTTPERDEKNAAHAEVGDLLGVYFEFYPEAPQGSADGMAANGTAQVHLAFADGQGFAWVGPTAFDLEVNRSGSIVQEHAILRVQSLAQDGWRDLSFQITVGDGDDAVTDHGRLTYHTEPFGQPTPLWVWLVLAVALGILILTWQKQRQADHEMRNASEAAMPAVSRTLTSGPADPPEPEAEDDDR